MSKEDIKVKRGNGMPLGVHRMGKRQWQFSVAMEHGKETSLELFRTGDKTCSYSLVLGKEYLVGGVFSVILTLPQDI